MAIDLKTVNSTEAEQAILDHLAANPGDNKIVAEFIKVEDFYHAAKKSSLEALMPAPESAQSRLEVEYLRTCCRIVKERAALREMAVRNLK